MVDQDEEEIRPEYVKVLRPYRFSFADLTAITATWVYNMFDGFTRWWDQFSDLCIQHAMYKRKNRDEVAFKASVMKDIAAL